MEDNIFDKVHEVDLKKTMEESYIDYAIPCAAGCQRRIKAGTAKSTVLYD